MPIKAYKYYKGKSFISCDYISVQASQSRKRWEGKLVNVHISPWPKEHTNYNQRFNISSSASLQEERFINECRTLHKLNPNQTALIVTPLFCGSHKSVGESCGSSSPGTLLLLLLVLQSNTIVAYIASLFCKPSHPLFFHVCKPRVQRLRPLPLPSSICLLLLYLLPLLLQHYVCRSRSIHYFDMDMPISHHNSHIITHTGYTYWICSLLMHGWLVVSTLTE